MPCVPWNKAPPTVSALMTMGAPALPTRFTLIAALVV
jgi:hypothetical protein